MIIPSIDLVGGRVVQLIGGETEAIDAGDPIPILEKLSVAGEVAVIDIDAARGDGSNIEVISELCGQASIRVGGGIRDVRSAVDWLDRGAAKVILGTAATSEIISQLPRDRVIVALDSRDGELLSHGWRRRTGESVMDRISELRSLCGGFLVTFVELEGEMAGTDLRRARSIIAAAGSTPVTIAGGIAGASEIVELDRMGADAQIGMVLYSGKMSLSEAITASLTSDRADGLWPTVVVDERGSALGLAWSNAESVHRAVETKRGIYWSRSSGIWEKGATSGATQELVQIDVDCDRDAMRFTVRQHETGFCHAGTWTCWGEDRGLGRLTRRLSELVGEQNLSGSNTVRLLQDSDLLASKLREEADELSAAVGSGDVAAEAADLLYFILVKALGAGVTMTDIERELDRRAHRVTRRPMQAKREYMR